MTTRYPVDPLMERLGIRRLHSGGGQQPGQLPQGLAALAVACGVSHRTAQRWAYVGLGRRQASDVAEHLDIEPADIWPEWVDWWDQVWALMDDDTDVCHRPDGLLMVEAA